MIKRLFYLSNLAFLLLYVILAWHNRLINDDFHYLADVHRYGIIKGTQQEYTIYSTRWLSVFVLDTVLSLMNYTHALLLFSLLTLAALISSFSYFLKNATNYFIDYKATTIVWLNFSLYCINAFFYSTFDIGTTWFWLSALPTYMWSFIFFCLGCGIILSNTSFTIVKWIVLALSFFYIGGAYEAFAAVVLLALTIAAIYLHFFMKALRDKNTYLARLFVGFLFCFSSLMVLYSGHGNTVRRSIIGEISFLRAFVLNMETTGWIGLHWISKILPFTLLFSLPLVLAGKNLSLKKSLQHEYVSNILKKIGLAAILYGFIIFIFNYPVTYLICGIGPGRALLPISFLTWALFAFAFFYVGNRSGIKEKTVKSLTIIALCLCLSLNIFNTVRQFFITHSYSQAYDTLMKELADKRQSNSVIYVAPLPPTGMLPSLDISTDSTANNNTFIKQSLGLKADLMLAK